MTDLAIRADDLIRAFYRRFATTVGGRVVERDGAVACIGVHPSPFVTNTAWRAEASTDPTKVLRTIDSIYGDAGFGCTLLTSSRTDTDMDVAAERTGRHVAEALPVMLMERPAIRRTWPAPTSCTARALRDEADLADFRRILIDGFFEGDDDGRSLVQATFAGLDSVADPDIGIFLGELDGRTASVAGAWMVGEDAGIGWVATVPWARRRGLGALVTARAVEFAFDRGAGRAALQASAAGRPVYERIGFSIIGLDRIWEETTPTSGR